MMVRVFALRSIILALLFACSVCSSPAQEREAAPRNIRPNSARPNIARPNIARPNIIVILADDLGYGDTSVYDGWVETPNLQRLADEGMLFTDFHANSSVCSPTRAAFLTGRYQQRVGIVDVIARHLETPPLDPDQQTIPRLMKQADYRTAIFGKWHLGTEAANNPTCFGFDEFRGYLPGYIDYHAHARDWYHNQQVEPQEGYTTHLITRNAVDFIRENKDAPFFLYVAHEAVHLPFQTPDDTPDRREPVPKDKQWDPERIRPKYKVMLEEMDRGIGEIVEAVKDAGISNHTMIFFFSDNGAIGAGSNKPFRGGKFSHFEGGHRVPAIAWWPGRIEAGSQSSDLITALDLLPTFAEIAQIETARNHPLDGISITRTLFHQERVPEREIFFGYEPKLGTAMRDGQWKMIVKEDQVQLYDLSNDIGERTNVATEYPERAARMEQSIDSWKDATTYQKDDPFGLPDGISYQHLERDKPRPLHIHVVKVDLKDDALSLGMHALPDPDGDGPAETSLASPLKHCEAAKFIVGVNANAWAMTPDPESGKTLGYVDGGAANILSLAVNEGMKISPAEETWSFWLDNRGHPGIGPAKRAVGELQLAISGFGKILENGVVSGANQPLHPRTALGLNKDRDELILVVVDGRRLNYSEGLSLRELAELMQELGCHDALNLDGGGSTALVMRNRDGELQIANRPSERTGPRPVPVFFGVREKQETSDQ